MVNEISEAETDTELIGRRCRGKKLAAVVNSSRDYMKLVDLRNVDDSVCEKATWLMGLHMVKESGVERAPSAGPAIRPCIAQPM